MGRSLSEHLHGRSKCVEGAFYESAMPARRRSVLDRDNHLLAKKHRDAQKEPSMKCEACGTRRPKKDLQHVTANGWDFWVCANELPCTEKS